MEMFTKLTNLHTHNKTHDTQMEQLTALILSILNPNPDNDSFGSPPSVHLHVPTPSSRTSSMTTNTCPVAPTSDTLPNQNPFDPGSINNAPIIAH